MKLAILGATGSIGQSALSVVESFPEEFSISALTAARQVEPLAKAVCRHRPEVVAVAGPEELALLRDKLTSLGVHPMPRLVWGAKGQIEAAVDSGAEVVLVAIVGQAGLGPTYAAVSRGLKVALANKESLVAGGELIMPLAARTGAEILPVDSEHSAIFQILGGLRAPAVRRLILTASGGPFYGYRSEDLENVTRQEALRHPSWQMGAKITCDSATLMNKGLEVIEAHHLFGLPYGKLEVLVHPQSLVHSIVEYEDGSQIAQCGPADMRLAIAYALSHPRRLPLLPTQKSQGLPGYQALELAQYEKGGQRGTLNFAEPDEKTFRALALARAAGEAGGTTTAILNGANEGAVELFLADQIRFCDIIPLVEETLGALPGKALTSIDEALAAGDLARLKAKELAGN